ncbi:Cna B-type domain-containing protein [Parafannyhessea sp. LCP21S3_E6]|uniref:Cna B-type domain-containing protein n=1 Tax=unclassified Parafannyhessea TaxID=2847323 RepID=UPI003F9C2743
MSNILDRAARMLADNRKLRRWCIAAGALAVVLVATVSALLVGNANALAGQDALNDAMTDDTRLYWEIAGTGESGWTAVDENVPVAEDSVLRLRLAFKLSSDQLDDQEAISYRLPEGLALPDTTKGETIAVFDGTDAGTADETGDTQIGSATIKGNVLTLTLDSAALDSVDGGDSSSSAVESGDAVATGSQAIEVSGFVDLDFTFDNLLLNNNGSVALRLGNARVLHVTKASAEEDVASLGGTSSESESLPDAAAPSESADANDASKESATAHKVAAAKAAPVALLASSGSGSEPAGKDFSSYITNATVEKVVNGKWTAATEVTEGDSVQVSLAYVLPADLLDGTTEAGRTIYYKLPNGVAVDTESQGRVTNKDNVEVGSYTIGTDGTIKIVFDQDKVMADDGSVDGTVTFMGTVSQLSGGESGTISFGNASTTIKVNKRTEAETHDLSISKTAAFADSTQKKIKYTVTASSNSGTGTVVNIKDTLSSTNASASFEKNSLVVKRLDPSGKETTVSNANPKYENNTLSIESLPALGKGEKYVVSYEVSVAPTSGTSNGGISNKAEGTSGNQASSDTKSLSWGTKTSKSGWYDGENNLIHWDITVNPNGSDIAGQSVADNLPEGTKLTGPYEIKGADGTVLTAGGKKGDSSINYTFPLTDASGRALSDAQKRQEYKITYSTTAPSENRKVENTATTQDKSGGTSSGTGTAYVKHRTLEVTKAHGADTSEGKDRKATWTSTVTLPDTKLESFTYTDTINNATDGNRGDLGADSHCAWAGELDKYLAKNQNLAINLADGSTYVYRGYWSNKAHQIRKGQEFETDDVTIKVSYFDKDNKKVVPNDANYRTKIKRFVVNVTVANGVEVVAKNMTLNNYPTHMATSEGSEGQTWKASNTGAVGDKKSTATTNFTIPKAVDKEVRVLDGNGDGHFAGGTVTKKLDSVSNSQLEYRIILNTDSKTGRTITVKDTLPAGMSIVDGEVWGRFFRSEYDEHETNYKGTSFAKGTNPTYTTKQNDDGTTTVIFTIKDYKYTEDYPLVAIHYKTSVAQDSEWSDLKVDRRTYSNTAEWNGHKDTQTTTVTRDVQNVVKTGEQVTSNGSPTNIMRYYVDINPAGKNLDKSSDTLVLTDTFGDANRYSPELLMDTIHLYAYRPDAENHKGAEIDKSRYSVTYDAAKGVMTVRVPDALACVLGYEERIDKSAVVEGYDVSNSVNLSGQWSSEKMTKLKNITHSATANRRHVTLYKVDSDNYRTLLPGATFTLAKWDSSSGWKTVSATEKTGADAGKSDYGMLSWDLNANNAKVTTDALFRVVETKAPAGYRLDETPHYFVVRGNSNESVDDAWAKVGYVPSVQKSDVTFINYSGGALYIPNTYTRLTVRKKWANSDGADALAPKDASVKVQLYQNTQKSDPDDTCTVTITARAVNESDRSWAKDKTITEKVKRGTAFKMKVSNWGIAFSVAIGDDAPIPYANNNVEYTEVSVPSAATNGASLSIVVLEPGSSVNGSNITVSEKEKPDDILTNKTAHGDAVTLASPTWSHDWDDLQTKDAEGHTLYYTVEEVSGPSGYTVAYANNEGIQTGTIVVTNTLPEGYVLPKTGGSGAGRYLATGMAIVVATAVLLARRKLASF